MTEKRRHRRYRRRLAVKYGTEGFTSSGFTSDISSGGLFIITTHLVALNTRLHLQLITGQTRSIYFEGEVRRQKISPPQLGTLAKPGFAVRFLSPEEVLGELVAGGQEERVLELRFTSPELLRQAYDRELRSGSAFVQTSLTLTQDARIPVRLELDFVPQTLEFEATVLLLSGNGAGVGILFTDRPALLAALKPFLG